MQSDRHRAIRVLRHGRSVAFVQRTRAFFLSGTVISILVSPSPTGAQTRDLQQMALDDFVAARMLVAKCPS